MSRTSCSVSMAGRTDRLKGELNAAPDGPAKAELQKLYDATVKNILQDVLKPR